MACSLLAWLGFLGGRFLGVGGASISSPCLPRWHYLQMQQLPEIEHGCSVWRLPLSDQTGAALLSALLADSRDQRCEQFQRIIERDPAFALWSVCRARSYARTEPRTVSDLARWLAADGLYVMQWTKPDEPSLDDVEPVQLDRWVELTWRGISAANIAGVLAADEFSKLSEDLANEARLVCLILDAVEWFCSTGPAISIADVVSGKTCLPVWLSDVLATLAQPEAVADGVIPLLIGTLEILSALFQEHKSQEHKPKKHKRLLNDTRRAAQLWGTQEESSANLLSLASRRLARLNELEEQFDESLNREKLASLKELSYGASHEINNPLANISSRAQALLRDETAIDRRQKLAMIHRQALRAHEMIASMAQFARPPRPEFNRVELLALIHEVIEQLTPLARTEGIEFVLDPQVLAITVTADATQIAIALESILQNAVQWTGSGGRVEVSMGRTQFRRSRHANVVEGVEIIIADNGCGLDERARRHLFDPFFSGREAGRGLGFGLSKSWEIVAYHDGRIDIEPRSEGGTVATLRLPIEPVAEQTLGAEQTKVQAAAE